MNRFHVCITNLHSNCWRASPRTAAASASTVGPSTIRQQRLLRAYIPLGLWCQTYTAECGSPTAGCCGVKRLPTRGSFSNARERAGREGKGRGGEGRKREEQTAARGTGSKHCGLLRPFLRAQQSLPGGRPRPGGEGSQASRCVEEQPFRQPELQSSPRCRR